MEGEDSASEDERSFSKASIPKRIAICVAGAIVNIVFGLVVYFILMASLGPYISNEVETVLNDYVAQSIGIQKGDKIVQIDDQKINSRYDMEKITQKITENRERTIKVERNGEIIEYKTNLTEIKTKSTGMYLDEKCKVVTLTPNSSSEKQGVQVNDEILEINHQEIHQDRQKALELIHQEGVNTILLKVKRGNQEVEIELKPDYVSNYYLGVNFKQAPDNFINRCINGGIETKEFALSIVDNLKQLATGNVGVDQMVGPVGISEAVAKTNGWEDFIYLLALISLSLGVTNLLPIPALDGGKILILIIEAIRRKPLKEKTEINIQLIGLSCIMALAIYVTYQDIIRIF